MASVPPPPPKWLFEKLSADEKAELNALRTILENVLGYSPAKIALFGHSANEPDEYRQLIVRYKYLSIRPP